MDQTLVADIGGTHARIGLVRGKSREVYAIERYSNKDFDSLESLLKHYLSRSPSEVAPSRACFAVASPVTSDTISFTNNNWSFHIPTLRSALALRSLHVMNDFEAVARSLPFLNTRDVIALGSEHLQPDRAQTMAVIGPGTGLGTGAAIPDGSGSVIPLPSEGGHAAFAPQDEREEFIHRVLLKEKGFVCIEDVLSGQGLENIYRVLHGAGELPCQRLSAREIIECAQAGNNDSALEALSCFSSILASVAGDFALSFGARGGIFIAGGILPRILKFIDPEKFRARFEAKGRYSSYVARIPSYVIIGSEPGLIGAASLFTDGKAERERIADA